MFHGSKMQTDDSMVCMDGRINRSILSVNHIRSINQSIYLSTNQSTNQPTKQPIKHIIISINLSICVSVNYLQHQVELWLWLAWSCLQFLLIMQPCEAGRWRHDRPQKRLLLQFRNDFCRGFLIPLREFNVRMSYIIYHISSYII